MDERYYLTAQGVRKITREGPFLPPDFHQWEDDDEPDENEGPHTAYQDQHTPAFLTNYQPSELTEVKQQLAMLLAERQGPSRARLVAQRVTPLLQRLMRGTPCAVVWAGMLATFFWNAAQSFDEQALAAVIDLPEEIPARFVAAAISTTVFAVWSFCFKTTIQNAVERKLDIGK